MTTANNIQHGGTHYKGKAIEPCQFAIKHLFQWREKGGIKYLKKASHYIAKLIEIEQSTGTIQPAPVDCEENLEDVKPESGKPSPVCPTVGPNVPYGSLMQIMPDGTIQPVHVESMETRTLRQLNVGLQKELDQLKRDYACKLAIYESEIAYLQQGGESICSNVESRQPIGPQ